MLKSPDEWDSQWETWFHRYSQGNPRLGKWLLSNYSITNENILEIGAGSGRESRFLSQKVKSVTCVDFAPHAVRLLANSSLPGNMHVLMADAANLPFPDKYFDLTFHKGFWILFDSNAKLEILLHEQLRVTRHISLAIVQNGLNDRQVREAGTKAQKDPLFRFRFFIPSEINSLACKIVTEHGIRAHIQILKYGAPSLSRFLLPLGALGDRFAVKIYKFLPWKFVECAVLQIVKV